MRGHPIVVFGTMSPIYPLSPLASTLLLTGVLFVPLCDAAPLTPQNGDDVSEGAADSEIRISVQHPSYCCNRGCSVDSRCPGKSIQSSYPEDNDNRVWMLTTEGIQSDLIQYNRIIPGHKYIINNVGGRRLRFGPEDPPGQYVTVLGEYDCVGPLAPLRTLFPNAAKEKQWWTHQRRPHEKWIFNAPMLSEIPLSARGFCITVTDLDTGKTAEVKLRVGTLTQH